MIRHLKANLCLLVLTILICAVLYPLALLAVGQAVFRGKADGSLITDKDGKVIGSHLIAQPFVGEEFFQPRPSSVGYNAAATGGTNWGANNPNLRKRVVGLLGPILKYRDGKPVGPDIVAWVHDGLGKDRKALTQWLGDDPYLAERWGTANVEFLATWEKNHSEAIAAWQKDHADAQVTPIVLAGLFFDDYVTDTSVAWPNSDGADQVAFFEIWWKAHPQVEVEPVPAELVMASGCGLDPHITLDGALYQLDRVAGKWAATAKRDTVQLKKEIESLLREQAAAPLGGAIGVRLVNVLEVNLALRAKYGS